MLHFRAQILYVSCELGRLIAVRNLSGSVRETLKYDLNKNKVKRAINNQLLKITHFGLVGSVIG